jgi:hypothetical protein
VSELGSAQVEEEEEDQVSVLKEAGDGSQLEMKRIEPSDAMSASGQQKRIQVRSQ